MGQPGVSSQCFLVSALFPFWLGSSTTAPFLIPKPAQQNLYANSRNASCTEVYVIDPFTASFSLLHTTTLSPRNDPVGGLAGSGCIRTSTTKGRLCRKIAMVPMVPLTACWRGVTSPFPSIQRPFKGPLILKWQRGGPIFSRRFGKRLLRV